MPQDQRVVSPKAAVALLTTTNGVTFMLFLLALTTNTESSSRAMRELIECLTPRVAAQVERWLAAQQVRAISVPRLVEGAVEFICSRLHTCRSRSPLDFAGYLEKAVLQFLEGDHTDTPAPGRVPQRDEAQLLGPAPRVERLAVLHAVLARLTPAERYVLELKLQPRATWESVARILRTSVSTAQRRHAAATERAQLIAVDVLSERLEECTEDKVDAPRWGVDENLAA
jgi:hypothetical protein